MSAAEGRAASPYHQGMKLSVCLLTRNQAAELPRALRSVARVAAESLVVDTGSCDATARVAAENGARVLQFAWEDDFAAGRNFAVEQAIGEWILWMNADEELSPGSAALLAGCMGQASIFGYFLRIVQTSGATATRKPPETVDLRLFRRRPDLPFVGRLHPVHGPESMEAIRKEGLHVASCDVTLLSHTPAGVPDASKLRWMRRLLELELADRPGNLHYLIELGRVLLMLGDEKGHEVLAEASEQIIPFRNAPAAPSAKVQVLLTYLLSVSPELSRGRLSAEEASELARRWFPASPAVLYGAAQRDFVEGRFAKAAEVLETLVRLGKSGAYDRSQTFHPGLIGEDALANLAACYRRLGRLDDARRCYHQLLGSESHAMLALQGLKAIEGIRSAGRG